MKPHRPFTIRATEDADAAGIIAVYAACWGEYDDMVLDTDVEMAHLHHAASHYRDLGGSAWVAEAPSELIDTSAVIDASTVVAGTVVAGTVAWRPLPENDGVKRRSKSAELQMLYVLPSARRKGLASYLVGMVERHVSEQGYEDFELWSDTRFTDAHRLYRSIGWTQLDETRVVDDLSHSIEFHFEKSLP
jgi:putative acetyltransferase